MTKEVVLKRLLTVLMLDMFFLCSISKWVGSSFGSYLSLYSSVGRVLLVLTGPLCVVVKHELWRFQHPLLFYYPWWTVVLCGYASMFFSFMLLMRVKRKLALALAIGCRVLSWCLFLFVTFGSEYFAFYIMQKM